MQYRNWPSISGIFAVYVLFGKGKRAKSWTDVVQQSDRFREFQVGPPGEERATSAKLSNWSSFSFFSAMGESGFVGKEIVFPSGGQSMLGSFVNAEVKAKITFQASWFSAHSPSHIPCFSPPFSESPSSGSRMKRFMRWRREDSPLSFLPHAGIK